MSLFIAESATNPTRATAGMDGRTKGDSSPRHSGVRRGALALSLTVLLIQACASGDVAAVADLVSEKNVDPFVGDESGRTPLAVACEAGHMEVVKFLMERDKEGRALKGAGGTTPLHVAASGGHIEVVKYLIDDRGMDPSCEDSDRFTPLYCAQNNTMRKFLLSRGARGSKAYRSRRHQATEPPSIPRPETPVSSSFLSPSGSAESLEVVVCMFEYMEGPLSYLSRVLPVAEGQGESRGKEAVCLMFQQVPHHTHFSLPVSR